MHAGTLQGCLSTYYGPFRATPDIGGRPGAQLLYLLTFKIVLINVTNANLPNDPYHFEGQLGKFSEFEMLAFTKMIGFLAFLCFTLENS